MEKSRMKWKPNLSEQGKISQYNFNLGMIEGWLDYAAKCGPGFIEVEQIEDNAWIVRQRGRDEREKRQDRGTDR